VTPAIPKQNADVVNERRREGLGKRRSGRRREGISIGVREVMILKMRQNEIGKAESEREVGARAREV
jgi:hypothetical protein